MIDLLKRFGDRRPEYAKVYREPIINRFTMVGREDEDARYERGKYFSRIYETYMYAALLGLRRDCFMPLTDMDSAYFLEIRTWQPQEMVHYLFMALLAKSGLDLTALEEMEEKQVEAELTKLSHLMEGYANGGFDIIQAKLNDDPMFFEGEYCFVELLEDLV
ncbi:MAG: hypothetical protein LCH81_05805 [Bacteroidetes bacterium]|nr:hypothetical protein [Bacteroidota bacterium]